MVQLQICGDDGLLMATRQWFRDLFPTLVVVVHLLPDEHGDSMVVGNVKDGVTEVCCRDWCVAV